jgi:hypothetical protein
VGSNLTVPVNILKGTEWGGGGGRTRETDKISSGLHNASHFLCHLIDWVYRFVSETECGGGKNRLLGRTVRMRNT